MDETTRDTQFEVAAQLLYHDLEPYLRDDIPYAEVERLLTRRIYDIGYHVLYHMPASKRSEYGDVPDCLEHVPDLAHWTDVT